MSSDSALKISKTRTPSTKKNKEQHVAKSQREKGGSECYKRKRRKAKPDVAKILYKETRNCRNQEHKLFVF